MARMVATTLVLALVATCHSPAAADWAYTHWDMSQDEVVAASNGTVRKLPQADRTRDDADHWELAAQGTYNDGMLRLPIGFTFDTRTGGLKCVMYNATGDDVGKLHQMLTQRYGNAATESDFASMHTTVWKTPDVIEFVSNQQPLAAAVTHCKP